MPLPRLAITLGDPSGIGPEIVAKALANPRVRAVCTPVLIGDPAAFAIHRVRRPSLEMLALPRLPRRFKVGAPSRDAGLSAIESLQQAVRLVKSGDVQGLVTAPVSKESFAFADHRYPGHTEWLAADSRAKAVAMLMVAGDLRAILMTRHVPLMKVSSALTAAVVRESALLGAAFVRRCLKRRRPHLVVCGLNPHAGDHGLIGNEEQRLLAPAVRRLQDRDFSIEGPYSSDAIFRDMTKRKYDLALACYHDQGMIPLKVHAGDRLVNITLGLPYIRTSPGHGTAYDIAGKGRASAGPMVEAILLAAAYSRA